MKLPARPALAAVLALVVGAGGAGYGLYMSTTHEVAVAGGTLQEGVIVDGPLSLLPPFATTQNSRDVAGLLFRGLTRPAADGRPEPALASAWEVDALATSYTFHLRHGLLWSDGSPLTSADAIFTLGVLEADQLRGSPAGDAWQGITATAPDATTIVYKLPSASAGFPALAASGLLPSKALSGRPAVQLRDTLDAPTSGPFRVAKVDRDVIHLQRNRHSPQPPLLDGIDIRLFTSESDALDALRAAKIDLLSGASPSAAASMRSDRKLVVAAPLTFSYAQVLFNQKTPALSDVAMRKALAQAIDRNGLINSVLFGFGQLDGSPIPPSITWAVARDSGPRYDKKAAARGLDAAGWQANRGNPTRSKAGAPLSLRLTAPDLPLYHAIADSMKHDLGQVGVPVKPTYVLPEKMFSDVLQPRNFDLALTLIDNGTDPDIFVFWHSSEAQTSGFNFSGMATDAFLDKDLEDGRFKPDIAARRTAYLDAQRILAANAAAIWLFDPSSPEVAATRVHGFRVPPAAAAGQRYEFVAAWYLNTMRVGNKK